MNTKNTIFLLVVALVVLGAIYYTSQKEKQTFTSAAIPEKTIPSVTSGTIERIVINAPDQKEVSLTKANGQWFTNVEKKYEADTSAVNAALKALEQPVKATVVSTNPNSFSEYQVSDTSGTKVQVYEQGKSEPKISMIVGKDGPSAFTTYVRLDDAEEVLNAKASLSMAFKRPDGWRDKQIFDFSGGSATRIEEAGTSATFTVARTEGDKWVFEGEPTGEADGARINSLANMMASLRANEFIESGETQTPADFGLEPARQTITLTYDDKSTSPAKPVTVTLLVGSEARNSGDWYAKRADKNHIFTIGSHVTESLSPDAQSIKVAPPEPEPTPAPEAPETTSTPAITSESVNETTETVTQDSLETTGTAPVTVPANDAQSTGSGLTTETAFTDAPTTAAP